MTQYINFLICNQHFVNVKTFRVMFDKIASVHFISTYIYILALDMTSTVPVVSAHF